MRKILQNVLKKKCINLVKIYGGSLNEIVIDIQISFATINSLELDTEGNLLVHVFDENDFDIFCEFSDLDESDQLTILSVLNTI